MRKTGLLIAAAGMLLCAAPPVVAHHAFSAEFDQSKPIKMSGAITKLEWTNPHAWLHIDVKGPDGKIVPWRLENGRAERAAAGRLVEERHQARDRGHHQRISRARGWAGGQRLPGQAARRQRSVCGLLGQVMQPDSR